MHCHSPNSCFACALLETLVVVPMFHSPVSVQALRSRQLGINTMVVLEQFSELDTLLTVSKRLGIRPVIGVRAKLHTRNNVGHWGSTSGMTASLDAMWFTKVLAEWATG